MYTYIYSKVVMGRGELAKKKKKGRKNMYIYIERMTYITQFYASSLEKNKSHDYRLQQKQ